MKIYEKMTPQQAWDFVQARQTRKYIGLDILDIRRVFLEGNEVTLLTYYLEQDKTVIETINENMSEILQYATKAKSLMVQLYFGKDFTLGIEEVNKLLTIVNSTSDNVQLTWGVEHTASTEFQLQICIFIII